MDQIKVTFAELGAAQSSITGTSNQITQQLTDLKGFVAGLTAEWSGDAATAYQSRQHEVDTAWTDLNQLLHDIGRRVGTVNDSMQATETANARRWA